MLLRHHRMGSRNRNPIDRTPSRQYLTQAHIHHLGLGQGPIHTPDNPMLKILTLSIQFRHRAARFDHQQFRH
jgi:hypothetical protein